MMLAVAPGKYAPIKYAPKMLAVAPGKSCRTREDNRLRTLKLELCQTFTYAKQKFDKAYSVQLVLSNQL